MTTKVFVYLLFAFSQLAIAASCYFYPVSRDEFFYLDTQNVPNAFTEYFDAYLHANPRINQFFNNVICRSRIVEIIFGLFIFNAFFAVIYLNIYRRFPKLGNAQDVSKFLILTAFFIFVLSYFGEMFYYVPFSTNYTLSHVFYLFYVYVFTAYYTENQNFIIKKMPAFVFVFAGIYIGMCNEHIPPVLIVFSFLGVLYDYFKNKKRTNIKISIFGISVFVGYILLFFAPANKVKIKTVDKSPLDITFSEYLHNIISIFKYYYYYNIELIIIGILILAGSLYFFRKNRIENAVLKRIFLYFFMAAASLAIVGFSPLAGVRLTFFATILLYLILCELLFLIIKEIKISNILEAAAYVWLIVFFVISVMITYNAGENYRAVAAEIKEHSRTNDNVVLNRGFSYFTPKFGPFNRKILLENGENYIDENPNEDTSQEFNLKKLFKIKNLSRQ